MTPHRGAWETTPAKWRKCLVAAAAMHVLPLTILAARSLAPLPFDASPQVEPSVRGMLAEIPPDSVADAGPVHRPVADSPDTSAANPPSPGPEAIAPSDQPPDGRPGASTEVAHPDSEPAAPKNPTRFAAYEPDQSLIEQLSKDLFAGMHQPLADDALEQLAQRSRTLERISNAQEVSRMAAAIAGAFGAQPARPPTSQPAAGDFDFQRALLTDVTCHTGDGETNFVETFGDGSGRTLQIVTRRLTNPATGRHAYEQSILEPGKPPVMLSATAEEFAAAEARHRPFEFLNRFPLARQLHREAVIPILDKLVADDSALLPPELRANTRAALPSAN